MEPMYGSKSSKYVPFKNTTLEIRLLRKMENILPV